MSGQLTMEKNINDISLAQAAMIAGIGYLIMIIIAPFSYGYVYSGIVIPEDAQLTINNVNKNEMLFRAGLSGFIIVILSDVLVSLGLYVFLSPVNRTLALLTAWFRLIYVAIFAVALNSLFDVLHLVSGIELANKLEVEKTQLVILHLAHKFDYGWLIGLVFFGMHLALVGALILRSNYIPRFLGILTILAALGYLSDSFAHFLMPNYVAYKDIFILIVLVPATIGELSLCLWLLIKGTKMKLDNNLT